MTRYKYERTILVPTASIEAVNLALRPTFGPNTLSVPVVPTTGDDIYVHNEEIVTAYGADWPMTEAQLEILTRIVEGVSGAIITNENWQAACSNRNLVEEYNRHQMEVAIIIRDADRPQIITALSNQGYNRANERFFTDALILQNDDSSQAARAWGDRWKVDVSGAAMNKIVVVARNFPQSLIFIAARNAVGIRNEFRERYDVDEFKAGGDSARIRLKNTRWSVSEILNIARLKRK